MTPSLVDSWFLNTLDLSNYVAPLIARISMIVLVMVSMLTTVAMCHVDNTGRHLHRVGEWKCEILFIRPPPPLKDHVIIVVIKGIARTQSPTIKNYAFELPTFGVIVGVNQTLVQWKGLTLEEPPSWSWLTSTPGKYALWFFLPML